MRPITLAAVAKEAGVSKSTASVALRGMGGVSEALAERVRAVAKRLGYVRDPVLARLAARRWRARGQRADRTLAYVSFTHPLTPDQAWKPTGRDREEIEAAAAELGYRVEYHAHRYGQDPRKLERVLESRGLRGVVLDSVFDPAFAERFAWSKFATVVLHEGLVPPPVPQVTPDFNLHLLTCMEHLVAAGYERPVFVGFDEPPGHRMTLQLEALFRELCRRTLPDVDPVYVRVHPDRVETMVGEVKASGADVVIGFTDIVYWWLRAHGVESPRDMGFCSLYADDAGDVTAGLVRSQVDILRRGLEIVDQSLRHAHLGRSPARYVVRVAATWRDGPTLPLAGAGGRPAGRQRPIPSSSSRAPRICSDAGLESSRSVPTERQRRCMSSLMSEE